MILILNEDKRRKNWNKNYKDSKGIESSESNLLIVIPTLGREDQQKAIYQFPESFRDRIFLVTKESHVNLLKEKNPGFNVLSISDETNGIAETRQKCLDILPKGKIWMIDDMVKFQCRNDDGRVTGHITDEELIDLYNTISEGLDIYPQIGISARQVNNTFMEFKKDVGRCYSTYGLRSDILEKENIRFDDLFSKNENIKLYEDYYVTLKLFSKGYSNTILFEWIFNHSHNKPGGNSSFRTNQTQIDSAEGIQSEFGKNYISIKIIESYWKDMNTRPEVTIKWKKIFEDSLKKVTTKSLF